MGAVITQRDAAIRITIRVKPRASQTKIAGLREQALEVLVAAPPIDGAANDAVRELLAKTLGVPRRDVAIVTGASGRSKIAEVQGISLEDAARRLGLAAERSER